MNKLCVLDGVLWGMGCLTLEPRKSSRFKTSGMKTLRQSVLFLSLLGKSEYRLLSLYLKELQSLVFGAFDFLEGTIHSP